MTQRHSFLAPPEKNSAVLYYPSDLWEDLKCLIIKLALSLERKNNSQISTGISKAEDFVLLLLNLICKMVIQSVNEQPMYHLCFLHFNPTKD